MKQIYLDNGATSFPKAPGVGQAMKDYIEKVGVNVNRSSYRATAEAALSTLTVREDLCRLFGAGEDPSYAIFTSGVTMSLNMIMKGALHPGDHLIISGMEHNAVARPATQLEAAGVAVSIAPCDEDGVLRLEEFEKLITPKTCLAVMQYASNVSGTIQPIGAIGAICRRHGVLLAVDSAQAAGHFAFDMRKLQIDALCFTGHKGLLGPSGIGGFVMNEAMNKALTPLIAGGTGSMSASLEMPPTLPDRYEAGTPNLPGIMGLGVALRYLQEVGLDALHRREMALTERFLSGLRGNEHIRIPGPADAKGRVGVISVDFLRQDNADERLMPIGHKLGLISEETYSAYLKREEQKNAEIERLNTVFLAPGEEINALLESAGTAPLTTGIRMSELIKRPQVSYDMLAPFDKERPPLSRSVREKVEVEIKYEGYIARQRAQVNEMLRLEGKKIPENIDYNDVYGLRLEAREKLDKVRPADIGQASRISGVSPADVSVLLIYLSK